MRYLQEVMESCFIDEDEHWLFRGGHHQGVPRIHAPNFTQDPSGQTLTTQGGRLAVWHIVNEKPLRAGWRTWSACGVASCVNPTHIGYGSSQAYGRAVARSGKFKNVPARMLANYRNTLSQRKVTRAMADDILVSNDTNAVLALRHGISMDTVSRVRCGKYQLPGNFFQGLMR